MSEGTLRTYNPLAYKVNNVEALDKNVVLAHGNKDQGAIKKLLEGTTYAFNTFICVNKGWHAFVLCVPQYENMMDPMGLFSDMPTDDPYANPGETLCWTFELRFEDEELRMYKLQKEFEMFKVVKERVHRAYFIGNYRDVHATALQFAALRAAPHRYNVLLSDCVEFAKEFCHCLLSYCSNYRHLESEVASNIKKASATGLSVERLSRRIRTSALLGNTFLGGVDVTSFLSQTGANAVLIIGFLLVYPVVVAFAVVYFMQK